MKLSIQLIISFFCLLLVQPVISQPVAVSENGRYLVNADGSPFFYLGDTAWELFHRLEFLNPDAQYHRRGLS